MEALMKSAGWIIATTLMAVPTAGPALGPAKPEAPKALEIAADRIETDYVDPVLARAIAAWLRAEAKALRRRPKSDEAVAEDVTKLLRAMSKDEHFALRYSPQPMPADIFAPKPAADVEAAAVRTARTNNFGVLKAERLPGNVGFLDLDAFTAPERMRNPLAAAMELLRHCDAMIIDVRYNGGGHAGGAALAASYFLPETPVQLLVRFQTRNARETLELRTEGALEAPRFLGKPVYILTGSGTFSAAEMFASLMQQRAGAIVVGEKTRGGVHPSSRVRLTPHFGMMLPTTRNALAAEPRSGSGGIVPDRPTAARVALAEAHRAALAGLLATRPGDALAEDWKKALGRLGQVGLGGSPGDPPAGR
jgi:hypothetical protein